MVRPQDWRLDQDLPREEGVVRLDLYLVLVDLNLDMLHLVDLATKHPQQL